MFYRLCFFILLFPFCLPGQTYLGKIKHYGIEEGLSHRDVQCTHQDKQGMIWLGTKYGLNRFDGKNFKWYTAETHGLQHNEINFILEDKNGLLWLMHTSAYMYTIPYGISIFNPITEEVSDFESFFEGNIPFTYADILNFESTDEGNLLFFTKQKQLFIYDGSFHSKSIPVEDFNNLREIKVGPNGWIWLVLHKRIQNQKEFDKTVCIVAFDSFGEEVVRIEHPSYEFGYIYDLKLDGTCKYLLSIDGPLRTEAFIRKANGLAIRDEKLQSLLKKSGIDRQCQNPYQPLAIYNDLLWISSGNAGPEEAPNLHALDLKGGQSIQWDKSYKQISHLTNFYFDNNGDIWASSQFGMFQISLKENYFSKVLHNTNGQSLPTRKMAIDAKNNLWVVDESLKDFWKINHQDGQKSRFSYPNAEKDGHILGYYFVYIFSAKNGHFYYSNDGYLIEFDPLGTYVKRHQIDKEKVLENGVWSIYEDENGIIWYATGSRRVGYWDGVKGTLLPPLDTARYVTYTYQFFKDQKGTTWMVTDGGLFTLDIENKKILNHYWKGGKDQYHLPFDKLYHVHEDENGDFWMATSGSGLVRWEQPGEAGGFSQFTQAHGLSNNNIYAVYEDAYDHLWLPSDYGIMRFNKNTHQCQAFLEEDGITHNEFNRISHFKASDDRLYFGGLNGVTAFYPKDFQTSDEKIPEAPLIITDYQHYNKDGELIHEKKSDLLNRHKIVLNPNDRFFRIEFALLTYSDVEKNQYAFMVDGVDDDWTFQKENAIRFSRMPYGEHTLRIKGQAFNGKWSKNELAIKVSVLKPFYLQNWFLILAGSLLILSGFLFYKWRVRSYKRRQKELEEIIEIRTEKIRTDKETIEAQNDILEKQAVELKSLEQLKSRFFANVSHELRTPLTLMLGPINKLEKGNISKEKEGSLIRFLKNSSVHLLKLVNEILDLSKLETNQLEIKETTVNFHDFLQPLLAQYKSASSSESLNFIFNYKAEKDLNILLDKAKFEKIVHNFLSNAVKFTPEDGTIELKVSDLNNQFLVMVKDTGPGIHPADLPHIFDRFYQSKQPDAPVQGGTGIGLSLCKELSELLDGRVWAESKLGKGSTFYFQFPKKEVSPEEEIKEVVSSKESLISINEIPPILSTQPTTNNQQLPASNKQPATTILIVEDNPELREYLSVLLGDSYNITTAENGLVAWNLLNSGPTVCNPHLIISDLMMPVMDGFQFLENVKGSDRLRHVPFIMLTARSDVRVKLRALRIGVDDYLTKPFVEEELTARIVNLLRNSEQRLSFAKEEKKETDAPILPQVDAEWLEEVETILSKNLSNNNFTLEMAADKVHLSVRQFQRRIKKVTGLAGHQYILEMRLNKTKELLERGRYATIKEVAYAVGFRHTRHFSAVFKKRFGASPSKYLSK